VLPILLSASLVAMSVVLFTITSTQLNVSSLATLPTTDKSLTIPVLLVGRAVLYVLQEIPFHVPHASPSMEQYII
jgi:hypothetical protein